MRSSADPGANSNFSCLCFALSFVFSSESVSTDRSTCCLLAIVLGGVAVCVMREFCVICRSLSLNEFLVRFFSVCVLVVFEIETKNR